MQTVDLLQVSLQENNTAPRPKVPHPAKSIQPSDWTRVGDKLLVHIKGAEPQRKIILMETNNTLIILSPHVVQCVIQ